MYEVFLNERKIVIAQPGNTLFINEPGIAANFNSVEEVKGWFLKFGSGETHLVVLTHPDPEKFLKDLFFPAFIAIQAAGGVVIRNNNLLFIKRLGKWDLPKGKIEKGESAQDAAIREVTEECGIKGNKITKVLPSTFHIYQSPYKHSFGQWILKETFWFEMTYNRTEDGTPQTSENITELRWFGKNELDEVLANTYENLKMIISLYMD